MPKSVPATSPPVSGQSEEVCHAERAAFLPSAAKLLQRLAYAVRARLCPALSTGDQPLAPPAVDHIPDGDGILTHRSRYTNNPTGTNLKINGITLLQDERQITTDGALAVPIS